MKPNIKSQAHRSFPFPKAHWWWYQEWNNALFMHLPVEKKALQALVPNTMELDCCQGTAWISFVLFNMERISFRYAPAFPPISNFGEINVRTYVLQNGIPGIYFFSLEASKKLSNWIAKNVSGMPYTYSEMAHFLTEKQWIESRNKEMESHLKLRYQIKEPLAEKSPLDYFLTERYVVFLQSFGKTKMFHVHHEEWDIRNVDVEIEELSYQYGDLAIGPEQFTHFHYSPGVPVIAQGRKGV